MAGASIGRFLGAEVGAAAGSVIEYSCKDNNDFCYDRYEQEEARCYRWSNLGSRVVAACKDRAADRRALCIKNRGKPHPDEPPEYNPFMDYPR